MIYEVTEHDNTAIDQLDFLDAVNGLVDIRTAITKLKAIEAAELSAGHDRELGA